ncbi:MAG: hypothetical protein KDC37_04115 [Flavobacteriales bacterium]|nr:hypothetical protein [Flavobacteriales bacterium]
MTIQRTSDLETQIYQLVHQLYELTEDEIKIVVGNGYIHSNIIVYYL